MQRITTRKSIQRSVARSVIALTLCCCAVNLSAAVTPEQQYNLAASHYQAGRWKLAIAEFDTFLSNHPAHHWGADAEFFAAEAAIQQGDYQDGAERLDRFAKGNQQHRFAAQAMFRRGECDYFQRHESAAADRLQRFAQLYPRHELLEFALPYLGELSLAAGNALQSQAYYQRALEKFPNGRMAAQCRFGLAQAFEAQGESEQAERFYRFVAGDKLSPASGEAKLRLAALLVKQLNQSAAIELLRDVIRNDSLAQWHPEANFLLLQARHSQGKWSEVVAVYQRAFASDETVAHRQEALLLVAEAHQELGQPEPAREVYVQAIEHHANANLRDDALVELAKLELSLNRAAAAKETIEKLTTLSADDSRLPALQRMWLANQIADSQFDAASEYLAGLSPRQRERLEPEATYFASLVDLGHHRYQAALDKLDQLDRHLTIDALRESIHVARATALVGLNRHREAIDPLQAYLAAKPNGIDATNCRANLVLSLAECGRWNEAGESHTLLDRTKLAEYASVTIRFADLAMAAKQYELANELYSNVASDSTSATDEQSERALSALAWLERNDQSRGDSAALSRLLQSHGESRLARTALVDAARAAANAGDQATALRHYHRAIDRFPASPEGAEALLGAGLIYDKLGQPQAAEAMWQLLLDHAEGAEYRDTAHYNLAWACMAQQQQVAAYEQFEILHRQHHSSDFWADATLRLAKRANEEQRYDEARRLAAEALATELSPAHRAHAEYLLGTIAANQADWRGVAAKMSQVLGLAEGRALHRPATYWLGEAQFQLRHFDKAEANFVALREQPSNGEAWEAMIPLRIAQCMAHRKDWQAAQEMAAAIAGDYPGFRKQYEADYLIGRCLAANAKFNDAREAYHRAVAAPLAAGTETASMARWMIGETYFHQKQYDDALRAYYAAAQFSTSPIWRAAALLQAGKCHEVRGEWGKAAQRYKDLLAISPTTRFHEEASRREKHALRQASLETDSSARTR